MRVARALVVLGMAICCQGVGIIHAQTDTADDSATRCHSLSSVDWSHIPDAVTQVTAATAVKGDAESVAHCDVSGYVAPNFGFRLRLPATGWNGKFIELGCSGPCGSTRHIVRCDDPLRRGYACIVSDGGHKAKGDVKWAYNNPQAPIDYFVLASHVTARAGKTIVEYYYDHYPDRSYFMGCSAGGMQAMFAAQRFPWDFDGIVAGAPALHLSGVWINWLWANRAFHDASGKPLFGAADMELLHQAVVDKCDMNDDLKDGLIGDPRRCDFEPAELHCTADNTQQCFSTEQVEAVERIYGGAVTSDGEHIVPPAAMKGSELTWLSLFSGTHAEPTYFYRYVGDWFRYANFRPNPGPDWQPSDFDFDRDYRRLGVAEGWEPAWKPDLRRFKRTGGKLLMYSGWSDAAEGVLRTTDYYETVERVIGDRSATQDFFRLFMIPGMNHCGGGEGPDTIDFLSHLERWVEQGQAPAQLIGAHLIRAGATRPEFPLDPERIEFTRPVYPYPLSAEYRGHGDPDDAASFLAIERGDEMINDRNRQQ